MKYLSQFQWFDFMGFMEGKKFKTIGCVPWEKYPTKELEGTKVEAVIVKDDTNYYVPEGKKASSNLYEKITFKVPKVIDIPENVEIRPINPEASVYGEFRNLLSVVAEDIEIVSK